MKKASAYKFQKNTIILRKKEIKKLKKQVKRLYKPTEKGK